MSQLYRAKSNKGESQTESTNLEDMTSTNMKELQKIKEEEEEKKKTSDVKM